MTENPTGGCRRILDDIAATHTKYTITRDGRPVAVVLAVDDYESLVETINVLSDAETMEAIAEAKAEDGPA